MIRTIGLSILLTSVALPAFAWDQDQFQQQNQNQFQKQQQLQQQNATATSSSKGGTGGLGGAGGTGTGGNATASSSPTVNVNNGASASGGSGGSASGNGGGNGWGYGQFPASSAYAPSFALSSMCQEAISGGVQAFIFGASGGRVYTLQFCKTRMKADYFRAQGREDMAKAAECKDDEFRALYKETGTPCREDMTKAELSQSAVPAQRAGYIGPNGFTPYPVGYKP